MVNPTKFRETVLSTRDSQQIRTTRPMSSEQIAQYHEDGYVIVPGFFDPEEVEPVRIACEEEPSQSLGLCFCSLERQIGRKLKMRSASSKSA